MAARNYSRSDPGKGPEAHLYQELTAERSPFRSAVADALAPEAREHLARLSTGLAGLETPSRRVLLPPVFTLTAH